MLYKAVTSMLMIVGMAIVGMTRRMGAVVR